jgi:hypothetical protein
MADGTITGLSNHVTITQGSLLVADRRIAVTKLVFELRQSAEDFAKSSKIAFAKSGVSSSFSGEIRAAGEIRGGNPVSGGKSGVGEIRCQGEIRGEIRCQSLMPPCGTRNDENGAGPW